MTLRTILLFLLAAIAVTLAPGPDIVTVIARSIAHGIRAGLVATLGFATGLIVHITLAALGLAIILQQSLRIQTAVKWLGAIYLVTLAVNIVRTKDAAAGDVQPRGLWRIYGQSILMNVLNPKVALFFLFFLYKFVDPAAPWPVRMQVMTLGGIFICCTLFCFGGAASVAGTLSVRLRRSTGAARVMRWITAGVFVILALRLAAG